MRNRLVFSFLNITQRNSLDQTTHEGVASRRWEKKIDSSILLSLTIHADICSDACADGTHDCDEQATCNKNGGSYECKCKEGYEGDGKTGGTGCLGNVYHSSIFIFVMNRARLCDIFMIRWI